MSMSSSIGRNHPYKSITLMDGSTGWQLTMVGLPSDDMFSKIWSASALQSPAKQTLLVDTHKAYLYAGSTVITTNSYGVQPNYYKSAFASLPPVKCDNGEGGWNDWFGLESEGFVDGWIVKMANDAKLSAQLAVRSRTEAEADPAFQSPGTSVRIFGSLPPLVESHRPRETAAFFASEGVDKICNYYRLLARSLKEGGVDTILCETLTSLQEAKVAMSACRDLCLPIVVCLEGTLMNEDMAIQTSSGASVVRDLLRWSSERGVLLEAVGFNCAPPENILDCLTSVHGDKALVRELQAARVGLVAYANGCDKGEDWVMKDEEKSWSECQFSTRQDLVATEQGTGYSDWVAKFIDKGATYVGGCCGLGPDFIRDIYARHVKDPREKKQGV